MTFCCIDYATGPQLTFNNDQSNVRKIIMDYCSETTSLPFLMACPHLQHLSLEHCNKLRSLNDLIHTDHLEYLSITYSGISSLDFLGGDYDEAYTKVFHIYYVDDNHVYAYLYFYVYLFIYICMYFEMK